MLMTSPFMNPDIDNQDVGLCFNHNCTKNALFDKIDGVFGVPIVVDDITANKYLRKELDEIIYSLASGLPKSRLNGNCERIKGKRGWNGVVITSSEIPILDFGEQQSGVKVRALHTQGIQWTKSAEEAEYIKQFVLKNYGFTGKEFATFVATIPLEELAKMHELALQKVKTFMVKKDNLSDRLANKYAVIYLTVELLNKAFQYDLSADKLFARLIQCEQNTIEERDNATKAFAAIIDFVYSNESRFVVRKQIEDRMVCNYGDYRPTNTYGTIIKYNKYWEVRLLEDKTKEILRQKGLDGEIRAIRKKWVKEGLAIGDGDHNTKKSVVNGQSARCDFLIIKGGIVEPEIAPLQFEKKETPVSNYTVDDEEAIKQLFGGDYEDKR